MMKENFTIREQKYVIKKKEKIKRIKCEYNFRRKGNNLKKGQEKDLKQHSTENG